MFSLGMFNFFHVTRLSPLSGLIITKTLHNFVLMSLQFCGLLESGLPAEWVISPIMRSGSRYCVFLSYQVPLAVSPMLVFVFVFLVLSLMFRFLFVSLLTWIFLASLYTLMFFSLLLVW